MNINIKNYIRTRVKICGLTRSIDIDAAVAAGVDAIGLVFYPESPRWVTPEQARMLCDNLPPFICIVGLFVDASPELIRTVLAQVPLDLLQFHGREDPTFCAAWGRRWIKALRMKLDGSLHCEPTQYQAAAGILLDTFDPALAGGTGHCFNWEKIHFLDLKLPIILAGGLTPININAAIAHSKPFGVDVSSGVETAPGIKDYFKIKAFIQGVRDGDSQR